MVGRWHVGGIAVAALSSFACSDPLPPPAQASLTFSVIPASSPPSGTQCVTGGETASVGDPPSQINPPTPGGRIVDGEDSQSANCTIRGSSTFSVSAQVEGRNTNPAATFPNSLVSFALERGSVPGSELGTAQVAIFTSSLTVTLQSMEEQPCTVQAFETDGREGLTIKEGAMFAHVDCPALIDARTPSTYCAGRGVLVLENCLIE